MGRLTLNVLLSFAQFEREVTSERIRGSGKIMRRVLGAISNNEDAGDISTLANPEIVDEIRKMKS